MGETCVYKSKLTDHFVQGESHEKNLINQGEKRAIHLGLFAAPDKSKLHCSELMRLFASDLNVTHERFFVSNKCLISK